jgi:DNA (cytosine-5)-methyltransferase 1
MARLHGFPDWFRFHATKWHGARQVGNSVPPPLAWAIATEFIKALQCSPYAPTKILPLGDIALLQTTMSSAASYWGVPNPIAKRNQKSHRRKRKQADIEALHQAQGVLFSNF